MQFKPLPVMTVLTLVSLVILIMLGNWQYERYADKRGAAPEDLPEVVTLQMEVLDLGDAPIQHVYGIADSEPIWRRYVPVNVVSTGRGETLLFMLDATGGPRPVQAAVPAGVTFEAEVRMFARETRASARNQPDENSWYTFDLPGILERYDLSDIQRVAEPIDIVIRNADDLTRTRTTTNPYGAPKPIDDLPPERHFGYAITWWGLAAALFVMYFVFHASQGRFSLRGR
ncbi:MAG: SURF1 family cytochrome oxidase biogenesis protein [Pseudomonadota bacterium]